MNTTLRKLFTGPSSNLRWSQEHSNTRALVKTQVNRFSLNEPRKQKNVQEFTTEPKSKPLNAKGYEDWPSKLQDSVTKPFQFLSIRPEIQFLKSVTADFLSTIKRRMLMKSIKNVWASNFSNSNQSEYWKKMMSNEQRLPTVEKVQEPIKTLDMLKAELEPEVVQGVGWAGQPIVKRVSPILPETCGNIADTINAVKDLPRSRRGKEESLLPSCASTINAAETSKAEQTHIKPKSISVRDESRIIHPNSKEEMVFNHQNTKYVYVEQGKESKQEEGALKGQNKTKVKAISINKKDQNTKKVKHSLYKSELLLTNHNKTKTKAKTTVCNTKSKLSNTKNTTKSKKIKPNLNGSGINKKSLLQSEILLNRQTNMQALPKTVMRMENRQFKTFSPVNQAKAALKISVKEKKSILVVTKKKNPGKVAEGSFSDDCKCPETLGIKTRGATNICGEAAGGEKKKKEKKEWKGKMCKVERKIKQKRKTFVCAPLEKYAKSKRKGQLPKCEKPEKKVAPRVVICPPIIEEDLAKGEKKKCEREVEEIKIRKRTKVCKPVIVYGKEEAAITIEKKVCTERKVQKKTSRHTTVCTPPGKSDKKKMSKRSA